MGTVPTTYVIIQFMRNNIGKIFGIARIVCSFAALYSAFVNNIPYNNPLSVIGAVAIVFGIVAIKKGPKTLERHRDCCRSSINYYIFLFIPFLYPRRIQIDN